MRKKYVVELTEEERERLLKLIRVGEAPARMLNRARILLKADTGEHAEGGEKPAPGDGEIARMLERCQIGSTRGPSMVGPRLA